MKLFFITLSILLTINLTPAHRAAAVKRWEETVSSEKTEMDKCKKQEKKIKEEMEQEEGRKVELEGRIGELKHRAESLDAELTEVRRRLVGKQRDIQKQQKELNHAEARLESRRAERHSLLQAAKVSHHLAFVIIRTGASVLPLLLFI